MRVAILVCALASLTGCESMVAQRYSVNADNNVALKALGATGVGVGEFRGPANFDPNCRLLGPLQTADGLTHTQYIRKAFEEEFKLAGSYAPGSPRVMLTGRVTHMEFSSTRGLTGGLWTIELTLTSSNGAKMNAKEEYEFASGFVAQTACKQTAEAFAPAVQNLVGKFVRSSEFARLVGSARTAAAPGAPAAQQLSGPQRVEAAFWESIRGSADPADFRTYMEQYPSGMYAAAARDRLAALAPVAGAAAAVQASPALPLTSGSGFPKPGDAWTYQLSMPKRAAEPRQRKYEVKVASVSGAEIVEHYSVEGGPSGEQKHWSGAYLVAPGAAVFSPYLAAFRDLTTQPGLGLVEIADPVCGGRLTCEVKASVVGREVVSVPAGRFETMKVKVDHAWRGMRGISMNLGITPNSRELYVWYAPAVKRAVKFSSRAVRGGRNVPFEADFDLDLVSYHLDAPK